jgi:hypothetical protein
VIDASYRHRHVKVGPHRNLNSAEHQFRLRRWGGAKSEWGKLVSHHLNPAQDLDTVARVIPPQSRFCIIVSPLLKHAFSGDERLNPPIVVCQKGAYDRPHVLVSDYRRRLRSL